MTWHDIPTVQTKPWCHCSKPTVVNNALRGSLESPVLSVPRSTRHRLFHFQHNLLDTLCVPLFICWSRSVDHFNWPFSVQWFDCVAQKAGISVDYRQYRIVLALGPLWKTGVLWHSPTVPMPTAAFQPEVHAIFCPGNFTRPITHFHLEHLVPGTGNKTEKVSVCVFPLWSFDQQMILTDVGPTATTSHSTPVHQAVVIKLTIQQLWRSV